MKRPLFIQHRVNLISDLSILNDLAMGCEIDLRSDLQNKHKIILSHDPWANGDELAEWLDVYSQKNMQGPLILNVKEDGLEQRALEMLHNHKISNFFFLDATIPTIVKWTTAQNEASFAVRLSSYEDLSSVLKFRGLVKWIWVDCFGARPVEFITDLQKQTNMKICLVSPELQGGKEEDIESFREWFNVADAVCTKVPQAWKKRFISL